MLHGEDDRIVPCEHSRWLVGHLPSAQLVTHPANGHVSILTYGPAALEWLAGHRAG